MFWTVGGDKVIRNQRDIVHKTTAAHFSPHSDERDMCDVDPPPILPQMVMPIFPPHSGDEYVVGCRHGGVGWMRAAQAQLVPMLMPSVVVGRATLTPGAPNRRL